MKKSEPSSGASRFVFLPIHPSPARAARSRSSTALVSTATRVRDSGPAASVMNAAQRQQTRTHDVVVVAAARVARDAVASSDRPSLGL